MNNRQEQLQAFDRLLNIMYELREKCPWDRVQTIESLRSYSIEEVYELASAIMKGDMQEVKKELGDLQEHIVFYSVIASETGDFDIADVMNSLCDKLIYRHPHIYGQTMPADTEEQVEKNWEQLKLKEKGGNKTVLSGVPEALPTVVKAQRVQDKVRRVGFDWKKREDVWTKVKEEIAELEVEMKAADNAANPDGLEAEFGDVMFSLINAARLYGINADNALERTNRKFISRFNYIEQRAKEQGKELKDMTLAEMDELWQEAKKKAV